MASKALGGSDVDVIGNTDGRFRFCDTVHEVFFLITSKSATACPLSTRSPGEIHISSFIDRVRTLRATEAGHPHRCR